MIMYMTIIRTLILLTMYCQLCESITNLTLYVEKKQLEKGRNAAKVTPLSKNLDKVKSYAGFFEVNHAYGSFMFFWYFPPIAKNLDKFNATPVIVWLEGGMGTSSMVNALRGNGPVRLTSNGSLSYNRHNWAVRSHLVYFDNPVGAGYSFTKKQGFPKNQIEVANDLYSAMKQFTTLFKLTKNPLYLTGEGYAGKYITALGVMIDKENHKGAFNMNFRGIAVENGFIDPPNMMAYGKYLYQLGVIDERARNRFHKIRLEIEDRLKKKKYKEAQIYYTKWMGDDNHTSLFENYTGISTLYDITQMGKREDDDKLLTGFLNQESTQNALHAHNVNFTETDAHVRQALQSDMLKSEAANLVILMNRYRVLLYHGQMNIKHGYPLMIDALKKYKWNGYKRYWNRKRNMWYVDGEVAGYWRRGVHFTGLLIRNVGDRISLRKPKWARQMIQNFIYSKSLNDK